MEGDFKHLCAPKCQGNRRPSAVSNFCGEKRRVLGVNRPAIDTDDEVVPGLDWNIFVLIAEDLETSGLGICTRIG